MSKRIFLLGTKKIRVGASRFVPIGTANIWGSSDPNYYYPGTGRFENYAGVKKDKKPAEVDDDHYDVLINTIHPIDDHVRVITAVTKTTTTTTTEVAETLTEWLP